LTDRPPTEIYPLSLHDALPIFESGPAARVRRLMDVGLAAAALILLSPLIATIALAIKLTSRGPIFYKQERLGLNRRPYEMVKFRDRKSTRLNSSHDQISYAVFC